MRLLGVLEKNPVLVASLLSCEEAVEIGATVALLGISYLGFTRAANTIRVWL